MSKKLKVLSIFLLIPFIAFGGNVKPKVDKGPGIIATITNGEILVNAAGVPYSAGGAATWGGISGSLTNQTDAYSAIVAASNAATWGTISGILTNQTDLKIQLNDKASLTLTNSCIISSNMYVLVNASNGTSVVNYQTMTNMAAYNASLLASTNLGTEGWRRVGSIGGYSLDKFLNDTIPRGLSVDEPRFSYSFGLGTNKSLDITWGSGDVFEPDFGYFHIPPGSKTLVDSSVNYAYWSTNSPYIQWTTGTRPNSENSVFIAEFSTAFGAIIAVREAYSAGELPLQLASMNSRVMPSIIIDGMTVFANSTNRNAVASSEGTEIRDMVQKVTHPSRNLENITNTTALVVYGHTNSIWTYIVTNAMPLGLWDNGTNMVTCDPTNWYRGVFVSAPDNTYMHWVLPTYEYTNFNDAVLGNDPTLIPGADPYIPKTYAYIFKGDDDGLRMSTDFWLDRRFMIRRGSSTIGSGGSGVSPTLNQVLASGAGTGGILPTGAGFPTTDDQLASKGYVDSVVNNISYGHVYVDRNGDDNTGIIRSSILPFATIQKAIDAAAMTADPTNRFIVMVSPDVYTGDISMSNYIGLVGADVESTIVDGSITYSPNYNDENGSEIQQLTISAINKPAVVINAGSDDAYIGIRSCYITSTYENGQTNKTTVLINRGGAEIYGTTYCELHDEPTNGSGTVRHAQIFEHTTDPANPGLSQFTSFSSSLQITSSDTNDDISLMYTHDNTDARCINTMQGNVANIFLDLTNGVYYNDVKLVSHNIAEGRTLSMATVLRLYTQPTNDINVFFGYASDGGAENVAIARGSHIRIIGSAISNIWYGAATTTNDAIRVYDSVYINNFTDYPYPRIYTNNGSLGKYFINTVTENGDQQFGGAVDYSSVNSITGVSTPAVGHLKQYAGTYGGIENPYFKDSSGNVIRQARDSFYNGFNTESTPLNVGEAVYIVPGSLSPDNTPKVARSIASDITTLPAIGIVSQIGGIATGAVGRIMLSGRLENSCDTSMFTPGQKLYVSATVAGGITNVAPTGNNIVQNIGTCHKSATNGYINVRMWGPDTFGNLTPNKYVTNNQSSVTFGAINTMDLNSATGHIAAMTVNTLITTNAAAGASSIQVGASIPFYLLANWPTLGFNAYWKNVTDQWSYGAGSVSKYGAYQGFDPTTGEMSYTFSTGAGNADVSFQLSSSKVLSILPNGNVTASGTLSGNIVRGPTAVFNNGTITNLTVPGTFTWQGNTVLTNRYNYDRFPFDPNSVGSNTILNVGGSDEAITLLWVEGYGQTAACTTTVTLVSKATNTLWTTGAITTNAIYTYGSTYARSTTFSNASVTVGQVRGLRLDSYSPISSNETVVIKYAF